MKKILIIEDNILEWGALEIILDFNKYKSDFSETGKDGLQKIRNTKFEAICVDLGLPDMSGINVINQIRKMDKNIPILVLTASVDIEDKEQAYNYLVDDYLHKPFNEEEFMMRLNAAINRKKIHLNSLNSNFLQVDGFYINFQNREVIVNSEFIHLSELQYNILELLTKNANKCLSYNSIIDIASNGDYNLSIVTLRSEIYRIRKLIEKDPENPKYIITKIKVGYLFKINNENSKLIGGANE